MASSPSEADAVLRFARDRHENACRSLKKGTQTPCKWNNEHLDELGLCKFYTPLAFRCRGFNAQGKRCGIRAFSRREGDDVEHLLCKTHKDQVVSCHARLDSAGKRCRATKRIDRHGFCDAHEIREEDFVREAVCTTLGKPLPMPHMRVATWKAAINTYETLLAFRCRGTTANGQRCECRVDLNSEVLCGAHANQVVQCHALLGGKRCPSDTNIDRHGFCGFHHIRELDFMREVLYLNLSIPLPMPHMKVESLDDATVEQDYEVSEELHETSEEEDDEEFDQKMKGEVLAQGDIQAERSTVEVHAKPEVLAQEGLHSAEIEVHVKQEPFIKDEPNLSDEPPLKKCKMVHETDEDKAPHAEHP